MPAKDLGAKHVCFKCGTRFYDLHKPSPVCPKCGADQREAPVVKPAAAEKRARPPARPVVAEPEEAVDAEAVVEELEEGEEDAEEAVAPDEEDEP
jgi:uncharacterized protein (TIGR02300 family)